MDDRNRRIMLLTSTSGDIYISTPDKNIPLEDLTEEEEDKFSDYDGLFIKPKNLEEAYYELQKYLGSTLIYFRIGNNDKSRCDVILANITVVDNCIELEYLEV